MIVTREQFVETVRSFLAETGMTKSRLGKDAINDDRFVDRLFNREADPRLGTAQRVCEFMDKYKAEAKGKKSS